MSLSKLLPALGILIALIFLFSLMKRRLKKNAPENQENSTKLSLVKSAIQKLKEECQPETFHWTMSSEELKNHVIKLYNSLIQVNQQLGLPRSPSMTPDEYNMLYASNVPAKGRQIQFVTDVYSATYFGNQTPDKKTMEAYIQSVALCLLESYKSH